MLKDDGMYRTKMEVFKKAKEAIGETIGTYDVNNRLLSKGNKGGLGQIIEEGLFGYSLNNNSEPDFKEICLELKVTPFKKNKNGSFSAKERLVLNIINYMDEYKKTFLNSSFWTKNQSLLLMFYLYEEDKDRKDYEIKETIIFEFPDDDLEIIKADWKYITNKIKEGKAHELSEADTMYLGACPKGSSKSSTKQQPFSQIKAMQRAFSLKQSYMTGIVRDYVIGKEKNEKIIKDFSIIKKNYFEDYIINKLKQYYGKSQLSLIEKFELDKKCKNINELLISRMLEIEGRISNTEEFLKANIKVKTIRVNYKGDKIKESMSFPTFKFNELIEEEWISSELRNMFESTKWLFAVFRFDKQDNLYFERAMFWKMTLHDLDNELKEVWERTKDIIKNGVELKEVKGKVKNNLPKIKDSRIAHVRPHSPKASYEPNNSYADELPDGRWMTKQSFWLKNTYIIEQINKNK